MDMALAFFLLDSFSIASRLLIFSANKTIVLLAFQIRGHTVLLFILYATENNETSFFYAEHFRNTKYSSSI